MMMMVMMMMTGEWRPKDGRQAGEGERTVEVSCSRTTEGKRCGKRGFITARESWVPQNSGKPDKDGIVWLQLCFRVPPGEGALRCAPDCYPKASGKNPIRYYPVKTERRRQP
jgi:hypothetical protein